MTTAPVQLVREPLPGDLTATALRLLVVFGTPLDHIKESALCLVSVSTAGRLGAWEQLSAVSCADVQNLCNQWVMKGTKEA